MKRLLISVLCLWSVAAMAQRPPSYTQIAQSYDWTQPGRFGVGLTLPAVCGVPSALFSKQWPIAGAVVLDSCNNKWYYWQGGTFHEWTGSGGGGGKVYAGPQLRNVNDSTVALDTNKTSGAPTFWQFWKTKDSLAALIPAQFSPVQGFGMLITGAYPNNTFTVDTNYISGVATSYVLRKIADSLANLPGGGADLIGIRDTLEIKQSIRGTLGTIYNDNNFTTSLANNGLTSFGGTNTLSGGDIVISGGSNDYTKGFYIDTISRLEYWKMSIKVQVTGSLAINGFAIGAYSRNSTLPTPEMLWYRPFDGYLRIEKGILLTSYAQSFTTMIPSLGDWLVMTFERQGNVFIGTIRNQTTNGAPLVVTYRHNLVYGTDATTPNTSSFGVWNVGGAFTIDSINVTSNELTRPRAYFLGDSKTDGAWAGTFERSWVNMLRTAGLESVNGGGSADKALEWVSRVAEMLRIDADVYFLTQPSNSQRAGTASATYEAQYQNIVAYLLAAGKRVIHIESFYETAQDNSAWNTFLSSTYSAGDIIPMYDVLQYAGALVADGVHPSELGNKLIYERMMQYIHLAGIEFKKPINTTPLWYSPKDAYVQIMGANKDTSAATGIYFGAANVYNPLLKRVGSALHLVAANEGGLFMDFAAANALFSGGARIRGIGPSTGEGVSIDYNSGISYIQSYNYGSSTYKGMIFNADSLAFRSAGPTVLKIDNNTIAVGANVQPASDAQFKIGPGSTILGQFLLSPGGLMTTPVSGMFEHNGTNAYVSTSAGRWRIDGDSSGTWTPTITLGANAASSANPTGTYIRQGNVVSWSVYVEVTPTAGSAAVLFDVSLPFASAMTTQFDAIGTGIASTNVASGETVRVLANDTNDRLAVSVDVVSSTTARNVYITGHYTIK